MATPVVRFSLFLSSYAPASFILALRYASTDPGLAIRLVALTTALSISAALAFRILSQGNEDQMTVITADQQREAFTSYLLGYLLPVILVDLSDTSAVTAVMVFLLILGIVFVRSNLVYLNPLLALAGYRLFAVTGTLSSIETERTSLLILTKAPHLATNYQVALSGADPVFRFGRLTSR